MNYKKISSFVFFIAILLRVLLSFFNFQAPDNHLEVSQIIKNESRLPTKDDCWEGFQPKFYHLAVAAILKVFHIENYWYQVLVAQFLSCVAGILTIYIVWRFLKNRGLSDKIKAISFSLIALNPELIGLSAQATNDSFVILFSTLAIYYTCDFFKSGRFGQFLLMTTFTVLAGLSKGNGLVIFLCILAIFFFKAIVEKKYSAYLIGFIVLFMAIVPFFGQYWDNYQHFGSPFVTNMETQPFPHFFKRTFYAYPGVTSILDSYFTFRLFDLVRHPATAYGNVWFPLHRTSLWSHMYGSAHFIYFDICPVGWRTTNALILNAGRAIFILALFPTIFLLRGLIAMLRRDGRILSVFFFGYISFIILYTLRMRDFGTMKAIFVFPAILPIAGLISEGASAVYKAFEGKRSVVLIFDLALSLLFTLYYFTIMTLIYKFFKIFVFALNA